MYSKAHTLLVVARILDIVNQVVSCNMTQSSCTHLVYNVPDVLAFDEGHMGLWGTLVLQYDYKVIEDAHALQYACRILSCSPVTFKQNVHARGTERTNTYPSTNITVF